MIVFLFLLWPLCGFIAFLLEAKIEGCEEFDRDAEDELKAALLLGPISFLALMDIMRIKSEKDPYFKQFMDWLLKEVNKL